MVTILRPLNISELLDRTFHLYRNHFPLFVGIVALPQIIVLALRLVGAAAIIKQPLGTFDPIGLIAGLASYVAIEISHAATIVAVSNYHLDRPVSIGSAFSAAKSSMLRVVLITFAIAIAAGIGLIFLIIPGVYLFLMWSLAIPVTVLEGGGLNASTTRSIVLTKGARGRIFVIYFLIVALAFVVSFIFQMPLGIVGAILGRGNPVIALPLIVIVSAIGTFISTSLVGPLITIALTLVYYDQRVRKEGFDLQLMMANLQAGPPVTAAATNA